MIRTMARHNPRSKKQPSADFQTASSADHSTINYLNLINYLKLHR